MRLVFIVKRMKGMVKVIWLDLIAVLLIAFFIVAIKDAYAIMLTAWDQYYKTLPFISNGYFYMPFVIGSAASIIHLLDQILHRNQQSASHEDEGMTGYVEEGEELQSPEQDLLPPEGVH